jgi:hypothetical protein
MKFSEVTVGQKFTMNNIEYTKTESVKVSCCKSVNAVKVDGGEKTMIKPNDEVELVTE